MIHFGKADVTCKVSDPSIANFHQRRSSLLMATSPLPILIKDDPAPWWQNLSLGEGLRSCAGGRPFVSSWFGLEVDSITCMPFWAKWFCCTKHNLDVVVSMYLPFQINKSSVSAYLFLLLLHLNWSGGARLHAKLKTESFLNQERASSETNMKFPRSSDCAFSGAKACFAAKLSIRRAKSALDSWRS